MSTHPQQDEAEFDKFADDYDAALNQGLSLTGESKEYFAEQRMRWLRKRLDALRFTPGKALDFGCGTGSSTPWFFSILGSGQLTGVDPSGDSLRIARESYAGHAAVFQSTEDPVEPDSLDLAFCNGVFHHIPSSERPAAVGYVYEALRPGGIFAFWENNPWNPATRYVMSRVPFDRDAILVFPHHARRLLRARGFEILKTDYQFIFPGCLGFLRFIEPTLCRWPLGGQYLVLARKPSFV